MAASSWLHHHRKSIIVASSSSSHHHHHHHHKFIIFASSSSQVHHRCIIIVILSSSSSHHRRRKFIIPVASSSLSQRDVTTYVPNEEWKRLELEKMPPSNASYECIGEYGLMINDDDLEHMFDYLLAKDVTSFMEVEKEEMKGKKSMMGYQAREWRTLIKNLMIGQETKDLLTLVGVKMLN
ncbi:hypothetical protein Tco_0019286 [Tanacetum coccineum]